MTSPTSRADSGSDLPVLLTPSDGLPAITDTRGEWQEMLDALTTVSGPVAIDVERAQSYRYSAKAYLVQLRRQGGRTYLIDPLAFEQPGREFADFSALHRLLADEEWIIHAATQDLPNLVELGIRPRVIFDTELAGRLLGLPRVGLGAMTERYCGVRLLKEHSAVDWSTRPIPGEWIAYAALDVELLHQLRDELWARLCAAGKDQWAREEFDYLYHWSGQPHPTKADNWRRTSGMHQVRSRRGAAIVREFVATRDEIACDLDKAPGRILQDKAITELASLVTDRSPAMPATRDMLAIDGFKRRTARRFEEDWLDALDRVEVMTPQELPALRVRSDAAPMPRIWESARPEAARRWERVRPAVVSKAEELNLPVENLISPAALREVLWNPPQPMNTTTIRTALSAHQVRCWQQDIIAPIIMTQLA